MPVIIRQEEKLLDAETDDLWEYMGDLFDVNGTRALLKELIRRGYEGRPITEVPEDVMRDVMDEVQPD